MISAIYLSLRFLMKTSSCTSATALWEESGNIKNKIENFFLLQKYGKIRQIKLVWNSSCSGLISLKSNNIDFIRLFTASSISYLLLEQSAE